MGFWKTPKGKHFHMFEGCHGATIPITSLKGLEACLDCCDKSTYIVGLPENLQSREDRDVAPSAPAGSGWLMVDTYADGTEYMTGMNGEVLNVKSPEGEIIIPTVIHEPKGIKLISKLPNVNITSDNLLDYYRRAQSIEMHIDNMKWFLSYALRGKPLMDGYDIKNFLPGYISFKKRHPHFDDFLTDLFSEENANKAKSLVGKTAKAAAVGMATAAVSTPVAGMAAAIGTWAGTA